MSDLPTSRHGSRKVRWRHRLLIVSASLAASLVVVSVALAAAGVLDTSFSGDGKIVTDLSPRSDVAFDMAMQPDGKLVVAGGADDGRQFGIVRYTTDGMLDTTFSGDGKAFINFTSRYDVANGVAVQADGKIVVAGESGAGGTNPRFALARLNGDGTLDTTFSGDGKLTTDFTAKEDFAQRVEIQADGRLVVAGVAGLGGGNAKFALARYDSDGTLDAAFGKVTTDFTSRDEWLNDLALQPDGKIVVVGIAGLWATNPKFAVARYNGDGTLDSTFDWDGKVTIDFTLKADYANGVAIQPDGKIVVAGASGVNGNAKFALARLTSSGGLDGWFAGDGTSSTDFTTNKDEGFAVALEADGKIVVVGVAGLRGTNPKFALARYNTDGTLDATFSDDGKTTTDFTSKEDVADAVVIQPDGRIVVAGQSGYGGSNPKFALARYLDQ